MGRILVAVLAIATHAVSSARPTPKALLINLPRHRERFEAVTGELSLRGVEYEKAEAVDGSQLTKEELTANVTALGRALMTRGMVGCFLSHRKCWQICAVRRARHALCLCPPPLARAHRAPLAHTPRRAPTPASLPSCAPQDARDGPMLVFEDDVVLADNFTDALAAAMEELPDDWDVLLIGALGAIHPRYYHVNVPHAIVAGGLRWPRWRARSARPRAATLSERTGTCRSGHVP
jgi:hypothetical protein